MSAIDRHRKELRQEIFSAIEAELDHAYAKHSSAPWSRHEFYGILKKEVDELWDDIKSDAKQEDVVAEALQVAAMAIRYLETGDTRRGEYPPIPSRKSTVL